MRFPLVAIMALLTGCVQYDLATAPDGERPSDTDGIDTNDDGGLFDKLGGHCLGIYGTVAKKDIVRVVCVKTDKDGDQIFEDSTSSGGNSGKSILAGGTGKYAGITGDDDYSFEMIKSPTGTPLFLTTTHVQWKLP